MAGAAFEFADLYSAVACRLPSFPSFQQGSLEMSFTFSIFMFLTDAAVLAAVFFSSRYTALKV